MIASDPPCVFPEIGAYAETAALCLWIVFVVLLPCPRFRHSCGPLASYAVLHRHGWILFPIHDVLSVYRTSSEPS